MTNSKIEQVRSTTTLLKGTLIERVEITELREDGVYSGSMYRVRCGVSNQCIGQFLTLENAVEYASKYDDGWK